MQTIRRFLGLMALAGLASATAQARALDCAGPLPDCLLAEAAAAAENAARPAERDEIHIAVATALADLGRIDEALRAAAQIGEPYTLAEALGDISTAAARAGDFDHAYRIAIDIVDARVRSARIAALERLAAAQAAAGEVDAAFDTVVAIDNPFRRSEAQAAIAVSVARTGDIPGAIRAASRIATQYWFTADQHRLKIASGLVSRSGDFDQFWFYEALVTIARIQAEKGDLIGALKTAKSIPDAAGRSRATARVAAVQAARGDIEGALETARRIEVAYGDLEAMVAIAAARATAGDFPAALELAGEIARAYGDFSGLVAIAVRQAGRGQVADSLATAAGIDNPHSRTQALAGIADALVRRGQVPEALEVAGRIPAAGDRAAAVRAIAVVLTERGRTAEALEVAGTAGRRDHGEVVVAIALTQAAAGDTEGAIATALWLEDDMYRAIALAGIAPFVR